MHNSQSNTPLLDLSPKSIFGFEPISGATPGGHQLRTQRSLLAELLQASTFEDPEDDDDEDCGTERCLSTPTTRPTCCTCNVGHGVPREYHARGCALTFTDTTTISEGDVVGPLTSPIPIPNKTYYKNAKQIEERQRIQYQRQVYRMQQEAHEQALAACRG
ncbi:hypothetical protein Agub_g3630 [Astrephomene gubernaculifera]|uniref:Uncharacterized protein n=1 Tax=Astrephomene gubernaculifera TaxID=47775 RepID=A0AAD3DL14_9CHLO|nr:hypothetical protein Agub_g3630 [Astrephomene gubernaculifera]